MKKLLMLPLLLLTLTLFGCEFKKDYYTITVTGNHFFHTGWDTEPLSNPTEALLDIDWDITKAVIFDDNKLIEIDVEDWRPYGTSDIEIKSTKEKIYVKPMDKVILIGD